MKFTSIFYFFAIKYFKLMSFELCCFFNNKIYKIYNKFISQLNLKKNLFKIFKGNKYKIHK
jgi:hypothetical protein